MYPWLVLSPVKKGLFCKFCPWFVTHAVGGGRKTVPLQKLVTKPLTNFKDIAGQDGDLQKHSNNLYHKRAMELGNAFLQTYKNPRLEIINRVHQQRLKQVEENRERLRPIIETIIFLGRQNIPFRGHRDDGQLFGGCLSSVKSDVAVNEGNFRELLMYRISSGDKKLEMHLKSASSNATYISKTTQNELITCCGNVISDQIVHRVQECQFYAILFDDTTDVSCTSQLSICLRYVYKGCVREDFVGFVNAFEELTKNNKSDTSDEENLIAPEFSLTGNAIAKIVLDFIKTKLKLSLKRCIGIGTDGCAVMISDVRGAVTEIQKEAKNAVKSPCFSHKLNNSISRSSKVPAIRDAVSIMKEVIGFFKSHPKRKTVLMSTLGSALTSLCETRWVERHEAVLQFATDLEKIVETLQKISKWHDPSTASKANSLMTTLCNARFIVALFCLSNLLCTTQSLSTLLQKVSIDVNESSLHVTNTIAVLTQRREKIDASINIIWQRIKCISENVGVELTIPRIPRYGGRQIHRENHEANTAEEFYRRCVYAPLLDFVIQDLKDRFSAETVDIFKLGVFMPRQLLQMPDKVISLLFDRFGPAIEVDKEIGVQLLKNEILLWKEKWAQLKDENVPNKALDVLAQCDKDVYGIIHKFLNILVTLPVTNTSAERSFSTLRRLKTYLRSTLGTERLLGLELLATHRDVEINADDVLCRYAKSARKLKFVLK